MGQQIFEYNLNTFLRIEYFLVNTCLFLAFMKKKLELNINRFPHVII